VALLCIRESLPTQLEVGIILYIHRTQDHGVDVIASRSRYVPFISLPFPTVRSWLQQNRPSTAAGSSFKCGVTGSLSINNSLSCFPRAANNPQCPLPSQATSSPHLHGVIFRSADPSEPKDLPCWSQSASQSRLHTAVCPLVRYPTVLTSRSWEHHTPVCLNDRCLFRTPGACSMFPTYMQGRANSRMTGGIPLHNSELVRGSLWPQQGA
jgi:hypothetical protein